MDNYEEEKREHEKKLTDFTPNEIDMTKLTDTDQRVTFIRGAAGMGKSVLATQLAYGWAKGEMYQEFKLLIMFECRELNKFMEDNKNQPKRKEVIGEFLKEKKVKCDLGNGDRILFVVDGLDELQDINNNSIIEELLDMNHPTYMMSKIILLGRPHIEYNLHQYKKIGGLRKLDIIGLSDTQIEDFIHRFYTKEGGSPINITKGSEGGYLPILHIPQFLNTYCCVAFLNQTADIRDPAELYCWTIYLLLLQHAKKKNEIEEISTVINEYSEALLALSSMCYDLLRKNKIILEEIPPLQGHGDAFVKSLFVKVKRNLPPQKYQFTHLSLMEFLSALHICNDTKHRMGIIKENLERDRDQVISFVCRLMAGYSSSVIIKEFLRNIKKSEEVKDKTFLKNMLTTLRTCSFMDYKIFKIAIEIIVYSLHKNLTDKEHLISQIEKLDCMNFNSEGADTTNIIAICKHLSEQCNCSDDEIKNAFNENTSFESFSVSSVDHLRYIKLMEINGGIKLCNMQLNSSVLQELSKDIFRKGHWVEISSCKFSDENYDECVSTQLNKLRVSDSVLNFSVFRTLCDWGLASKTFELWQLSIKNDWWNMLIDTMEERAKREPKGPNFKLKRLHIKQRSGEISIDVRSRVRKFSYVAAVDVK